MKNWTSIIFILFLSISFGTEQVLPKIKLKDLKNKARQLDEFYNNGPLLINFWNLACEPCKKEMKELNKLHLKYQDKGFSVVSINIDNTRSMAKVKSYVNSQKFAFSVLSDPRASLFRKLGGKIMPYVIIADTSGVIINKHVGYNPGDEIDLENEILYLLKIKRPLLDSTSTIISKPE
tara:strand:+ start:1018 stop:1551 length:534 start_codon:yes stop_codon:yes gene_type:complete